MSPDDENKDMQILFSANDDSISLTQYVSSIVLNNVIENGNSIMNNNSNSNSTSNNTSHKIKLEQQKDNTSRALDAQNSLPCATGYDDSNINSMNNCFNHDIKLKNRRKSTSSSFSKETMLDYIFSETNEFTTQSSTPTTTSSDEDQQESIVSSVMLPIDDNEFAIIKPSGKNQEISYEIYSPVNSIPEHHDHSSTLKDSIRIPDLPRSSSFGSSRSFTNNFINPRTEAIRSRSLRYSSEINNHLDSTSVHGHKYYQDISKSSHLTPVDNGLSFDCPRNLDSPIKDKNSCIFESNGLFIKRDHPLFSQKFSRKVFVGGLPRDITLDNLEEQFSIFGPLHVDWPNREDENIPPNGFAFLHFENNKGVEKLYDSVSSVKSRNKFSLSSSSVKTKEVEIKFWRMADCEYIVGDKNLVEVGQTVFVGALPRITTAVELANFMSNTFGPVIYTAIDVDLIYGYPKGAGRVTFANVESYSQSLQSHYIDMDLGFAGKKKRIEIKPFLLTDQKCEVCSSCRPGITISEYCYRCSRFICENCVLLPSCVHATRHNTVSRNIDNPYWFTE